MKIGAPHRSLGFSFHPSRDSGFLPTVDRLVLFPYQNMDKHGYLSQKFGVLMFTSTRNRVGKHGKEEL